MVAGMPKGFLVSPPPVQGGRLPLPEVSAALDGAVSFRELVEQLPLVIYIDEANALSSNIYTSPQTTETFGYTPEDWASQSDLFRLILHPDDRERVLEEHRQAHASGEPLVSEYRIVARDGREVWVHDEAQVVRDDQDRSRYLRGYLLDISERKQRERIAAASEARSRAMLAAALDCVITVDHHGAILEFNPAAERTFGYERSEVIGQDIAELLVPLRLRKAHSAGLARYLSTGESRVLGRRLEMPALRADGGELMVELSIVRVELPGTAVFTAYMRDITEKLDREAELARSAAIVSSSFNAIIGRTPAGIVTSWNAAAEQIFGYSAAEVVGRSIALLEPPDQAGDLARVNERLQRDGRPDTFEAVRIRKNGVRIDVETTVSPILDSAGELVAVSAISRDISERRRAEEHLRQEEERYRSLVENVPLVIYTRTLEPDSAASRALFMSGQVEAMLELSAHEAQPGRVREMIHPDDFERIAPLYDTANRDHLPLSLQYRLITPSGRTLWVHDESRIVYDGLGKPLYAQGYLRDITSQVAAEAETADALERERNARLEAEQARAAIASTVEKISDAFFSFDRELRYLYINSAAAGIIRHDPASVIGKTPPEVLGEQVPAAFLELLRRARDGTPVEIDDYESPLGGTFDLRAHPSPDGVWLFLRDVTERRKLEESLRQAQKMEAVGQLAGGIAHDFNNILTAIDGYAEFALRDLDNPDPDITRLRDELTTIKQAGERAADLTRQLLAYSRQQVMQRQLVDLNAIVERSGRLLDRLIGENITVALLTSPGLPPLEADAAQLEQVIVNLALNARDAMPDGGTLTIQTTPVSLTGQEAAHHGLPGGNYLSLSVQDTGVGIDEALQSQIFEPFFTTKPLGHGTGLGLATVYGIVRQTGGTITLTSELGVGSSFDVYLPACSGSVTQPESLRAQPNQGNERILLVEDEEVLRELISEMLGAKGYDVVVVPDPAAALDRARDNSFELIITDVRLPIMSGAALVIALRQQQPTLGALFISGYASTIIDDTTLNHRTRFLPKPFTAEDIASAARDILDVTHHNQLARIQ
jgi:two-component system cell cycle sensor histidine kinase/response regulator CckA